MKTATIEIPLEVKREFEILAKERGQDIQSFILELLLESAEVIEDRELGRQAMEIKKTRLMTAEESMDFFKELKADVTTS